MHHCCIFGRIVHICYQYYFMWRLDAIDRSVKELSQPDDGISFSENQISQRALAAKKKTVFELLKRR